MKPVGRERDKQIAELKGEKVIDNELYVCEMFRGKDGLCEHNPIPRSTSWNDAKELLMELHSLIHHPYVLEIQMGEKWIGISIMLIDVKVMAMIKNNKVEEAMADAVSQAWLEWRENET